MHKQGWPAIEAACLHCMALLCIQLDYGGFRTILFFCLVCGLLEKKDAKKMRIVLYSRFYNIPGFSDPVTYICIYIFVVFKGMTHKQNKLLMHVKGLGQAIRARTEVCGKKLNIIRRCGYILRRRGYG